MKKISRIDSADSYAVAMSVVGDYGLEHVVQGCDSPAEILGRVFEVFSESMSEINAYDLAISEYNAAVRDVYVSLV